MTRLLFAALLALAGLALSAGQLSSSSSSSSARYASLSSSSSSPLAYPSLSSSSSSPLRYPSLSSSSSSIPAASSTGVAFTNPLSFVLGSNGSPLPATINVTLPQAAQLLNSSMAVPSFPFPAVIATSAAPSAGSLYVVFFQPIPNTLFPSLPPTLATASVNLTYGYFTVLTSLSGDDASSVNGLLQSASITLAATLPAQYYGGPVPLFNVSVLELTAATYAVVSSLNISLSSVTPGMVMPYAVGWASLQVSLYVTPAPVSPFVALSVLSVTANSSAALGGNYSLTSSSVSLFGGANNFSVVLSVESGSLSQTRFTGAFQNITAALAGVVYTAPLLSPPSATYNTTDPHFIGPLWNVSVVLLTAAVTPGSDGQNSTQWTVPIVVNLVNQQPVITVLNTAVLQSIAVGVPSSTVYTLPIQQANVSYYDVDSYGAPELLSIACTAGGQICATNATNTYCAASRLSLSAPLSQLNSNAFAFTYTPPSSLFVSSNETAAITVTLNDEGHSGNVALSASFSFSLLLVPVPSVPSVTVTPINVQQVNTTTLLATWPAYLDTAPLNPAISYYLLTYSCIFCSGFTPVITLNITAGSSRSFSVYLTGLLPASVYAVQVAAGNALGAGAFSSYNTAFTLSNIPYPVGLTSCGAVFCGVQWTQAVAPQAPAVYLSLAFQDDSLTVVNNASNTYISISSYSLTYGLLNGSALVSQTIAVDPESSSASASLPQLQGDSEYEFTVQAYSAYFNLYSPATSVLAATLADPPAITAFSISDPNLSATAADFAVYHSGLVLTLTFAADISIDSSLGLPAALFTFNTPDGSAGQLSNWTQSGPNSLNATVVSAAQYTGTNFQIGQLTVTPSVDADIVASSTLSYPVSSTSPALTGTFGSFAFGSNALTVTVSSTTTPVTELQLASLIGFSGSNGNFSYEITLISTSAAYLINGSSTQQLTSFGYDVQQQVNSTGLNFTGGADIATLHQSLLGLYLMVNAFYSGSVAFRVDGYTQLNGSSTFQLTSTAVGLVTIVAMPIPPVIEFAGNSSSLQLSVSNYALPLSALIPGLALYDVDADSSINPYANTAALYTFTVSWSTAIVGSFLALQPNSGFSNSATLITLPDLGTLASLQASVGGVTSFTATAPMPTLQALFASLELSTFAFDPTLTPSLLTVTLTDPQSLSVSQTFNLTQNISTVPAADIRGGWLLPSMNGFVLLLDVTVLTPLATSGAVFSPSLLFLSNSSFGQGGYCQYIPADPVAQYLTAAQQTAGSAIQCLFGAGAAFALDPTDSSRLTPEVQLVNGSTALTVVTGGLAGGQGGGGYISVLPSLSAYGTPSFSLSGPTVLSYCPDEPLTINSILSSQGVGFGTSFSWTVSDSTVNANVAAVSGLSSSASLTLSDVDAFGIAENGTYTFTLLVTNLVGASSSQAITLTRLDSPAATLLGSGVQTDSITDLILLSFTPQLPGACFSASSAIAYSWTQTAGATVALDVATVSTATLGFVKPYLSNGLSYGHSYTFALTASLVNIPSSSTTRSITLSINDLPLIAGIAGPSIFVVGQAAGFTLTTAGATQLPTQGEQVTYYWSCVSSAGVVFLPLAQTQTLPVTASASLSVAASVLPVDSYTFTVSISVDGGAAQAASTQAFVVAGNPVGINITARTGATAVQGSVLVNDFTKLSLSASAAYDNCTFQWSCVGCPAGFSLPANSSSSYLLVLNPQSAAGFWTPLASYQFRVDVVPASDEFSASFSSVIVAVNSPPTPPASQPLTITCPLCAAGTLNGYANGLNQWTLSVAQPATGQSGWSGLAPLLYQFFFLDAYNNSNFISSATSALSVTVPLPLGYGSAGMLVVGVVVYDSNGGQTSYSTWNAVSPSVTLDPSVSSSQLLNNLLSSSSNLSPSGFLAAVVSLASAASALSNSSSGNSTEELAQRSALLAAVAANIASVAPALAFQAVNSLVGNGAVSDPATLGAATAVLSAVLVNALTDPAFLSTPAQLGNLFGIISGLMSANNQPVSGAAGRRLLSSAYVSSGLRAQTQANVSALYEQSLRALSSAFLGTSAAPASELVRSSTTAAGVYRAAYTQGVVSAFTLTLAGITVSLTAGADWLAGNTLPADPLSAFDIQLGIITPDPYLGLLLVASNTSYSDYTVWFDVVDVVNGSSQSGLVFANGTDSPAVVFNINDLPTLSSLTAGTYHVECVEWDSYYGYVPINGTQPDSTGAFSCSPTHPGSYVSYGTVSDNEVTGPTPTGQSAASSSSSSSTGATGAYGQFAFLFSGYNGSQSEGGYYFWMAVSIALCLLFPVFALTYRPAAAVPAGSNYGEKTMAPVPDTAPQVYAVDVPAAAAAGGVAGGLDVANREQRTSTVDAGSMDYGDVNALKRNVYAQEEKVREDDGSEEAGDANEGEVGFVVHQ